MAHSSIRIAIMNARAHETTAVWFVYCIYDTDRYSVGADPQLRSVDITVTLLHRIYINDMLTAAVGGVPERDGCAKSAPPEDGGEKVR